VRVPTASDSFGAAFRGCGLYPAKGVVRRGLIGQCVLGCGSSLGWRRRYSHMSLQASMTPTTAALTDSMVAVGVDQRPAHAGAGHIGVDADCLHFAARNRHGLGQGTDRTRGYRTPRCRSRTPGLRLGVEDYESGNTGCQVQRHRERDP
jgi:hypothetical protein